MVEIVTPLVISLDTSPRLMVIMFTDLVDSTALKQRIGPEIYRKIKSRHDVFLREALSLSPSGRAIKDTGDGCLLSFDSVGQAINSALLFQWRMAHEDWPCSFSSRVGLHLGEVEPVRSEITGEDDVMSTAIDFAARAMSIGQGGQILLTRAVFDAARQAVRLHPSTDPDATLPAIQWIAHGPYMFKGASEPIEIFEVGAVPIAPLSPPPDTDKAKRHIRPGDEETLGWRPAVNRALENEPNWILAEKLGEGGFGEVWLAEQAKSHAKRVYKFCFDPERLRALKREVVLFRLLKEALGDRRDIAAVRDWRFDHSPYFVELEYCPEGNLNQWAEKNGGIEKVPLEQRIVLMSKIAEALSAAHSVGILHKDIKPSNILMAVDAEGVSYPRLTDFGIGILTDRARLAHYNITEIGFTASSISVNDSSHTGTRMYSPPESLLNKPHTVQGDVFALGVLFYQMVVGDFHRPLAFGWERDISDTLLRDDIAAAVEGEPSRRLPSAATFAENLRTLEERRNALVLQTRARDDAEASRVRTLALAKLAARRKRLLVSGGVILLLLLIVIIAFAIVLREVVRERGVALKAVQSEKLAEQAQKVELANEKKISNMITSALAAPVEKGYDVTVLQVLKNIDPLLENPNNRDLPVEVQDGVRIAAAKSFLAFHQWDDAIDEYRSALAYHTKAGAPEDASVAEMYDGLAQAMFGKDNSANLNEVYGLYNKTYQIRLRILGIDDPLTQEVKGYMAVMTLTNQSREKGEEMYLETFRQLMHQNMSTQECRSEIAADVGQVAYLINKNDRAGAIAFLRTCLKPAMENDLTKAQVPDGLGYMAHYVAKLGNLDGAEGCALGAVQFSSEIDGPDTTAHAKILSYTGYSFVQRKRLPEEGLAMLQQAADIARRKLGPLHDDTVEYTSLWMQCLEEMGRKGESDIVRKNLLSEVPKDDPRFPELRAGVLNELGNAVENGQDSTLEERLQAQADLREALQLVRQSDGTSSPLFYSIALNLTNALRRDGHNAESESVSRELLSVTKNKFGNSDRRVGIVLCSLGMDLQNEGRFSEAIDALTQACDIFDAVQGDAVDLVSPLSHLADAQTSLGRFGDAEISLRKLVETTDELNGTDSNENIDAKRRLAGVIAQRNRPQALAMYDSVLASSIKNLGENDGLTQKIQQEMDSLRSPPANLNSATRPVVK
jgi:serine/threonine protein kinase/class 3 adenylate cyclase